MDRLAKAWGWYRGRAAWAQALVLVLLLGTAIVPLAAATSDDPDDPIAFIRGRATPTTTSPPGDERPAQGIEAVLASSLRPFPECGAVLDHVRQKASELAGPYGIPWSGAYGVLEDVATARRSGGAPAMAAQESMAVAGGDTAAAPKAGVDYSGTNVQEEGVDEPDLVKTDGRTVFVVAGGQVQVVDVSSGEPKLVASIPVPDGWGGQLLLDGDRLLVVSAGGGPPIAQPVVPEGGAPGVSADASMIRPTALTRLTLLDVGDPSQPKTIATMTVDGNALTSRLVDGVVRLVVRSGPTGLVFDTPTAEGAFAERTAVERNRDVIARSSIANWLPSYRLEDRRPQHEGTRTGVLTPCDRVYTPPEFAGLGTISVLTFDLSEGLAPGDAATVMADGETVYASRERLYVATNRWVDPNLPLEEQQKAVPAFTTQIHQFDIAGDAPARHTASGEVRGHVLNQFSLSEHDGVLRVATTEGFPGVVPQGPGQEAATSESFVSVLAARDGKLEQVGQVGGLGRGERIYSVRFIGDRGYVVTFRQVDPLYVVDLSDPARPAVRGELKIPGYSAYLHPVGEGRLLGIGQDATDQGQRLGFQLSLFDVRDPANPTRLHSTRVGAPGGHGSSEAEYDHHAFLYWPATGLTVVPLEAAAGDPERPQWFTGAVAFSVDAGRGIEERARLTHQAEDAAPGSPAYEGYEPMAQVRRSLVVGSTLMTVSDKGLLANDLGTLARRGWLAFPAAPTDQGSR